MLTADGAAVWVGTGAVVLGVIGAVVAAGSGLAALLRHLARQHAPPPIPSRLRRIGGATVQAAVAGVMVGFALWRRLLRGPDER